MTKSSYQRRGVVGLLSLFCLIALLALTTLTDDAAAAAAMPKLPLVQQVGVIPVQWETEAEELEDQKLSLARAFSEAVRGARRFRVLDDELVLQAWSSEDGRQELVDQFELHALMGLSVVPRDDTVSMTARLMNPGMKSLLIETETIPRAWFARAQAADVKARVEELVFRLVNRIPVDVSVTSVQGPFVTLSGGSEQGIRAGDEVDLVRTRIRALHPATGTWLEFHKESLGSAQVIEAKNFTAVARLMKLTREDGIEVGDGARIGAIAARRKFASQGQEQSFKDAGEPATIIVPPLYYGESSTPGSQPQQAAQAKPGDGLEGTERAPVNHAAVPSAPSQPGEAMQQAESEQEGSVWDDFKFTDANDKWLDEISLYAGPSWWSVSSRGFSAAGEFPVWLLNSVGATATRSLLLNFKLGFGGGLLFGSTSKGRYTGYDSFGRIYWEDSFATTGKVFTTWRAGGMGRFSGLSVQKEKFGGGDWVRGGGFAGLGGQLDLERNGRYDWFADLALMPLNIGRMGYNGKMQLVESSMGWQLKLGAYEERVPAAIQYGAALEISDERMTLKSGLRPHVKDYSLQALARYSF